MMPQTGNNTTGLAVIIPLLWGPIFEKHGASLKARWRSSTSEAVDVIEVIAEQLKGSPDSPKPSAWSWMFPPDAEPSVVETGMQELFTTATGVSIDEAALDKDYLGESEPSRFGQLLKDVYPAKAFEDLIQKYFIGDVTLQDPRANAIITGLKDPCEDYNPDEYALDKPLKKP